MFPAAQILQNDPYLVCPSLLSVPTEDLYPWDQDLAIGVKLS